MNRCFENLEDMSKTLKEARQVLVAIRNELHDLVGMGQTARYLSQTIRVEAAHLPSGNSFSALADNIASTVDAFEKSLNIMNKTTNEGRPIIEQLVERLD